MEKCCRTCLKEKRFNSMKLLSTKWNDTLLSFADMLMDIVILNKEITSDETSFRICSSCELDLITAYNFKIVCQNTEKILAERLTKTIIKELPPIDIEEIKCETIIDDFSDNLEETSNDLIDKCKEQPDQTSDVEIKPKVKSTFKKTLKPANRRKCRSCNISFEEQKFYQKHRRDVHNDSASKREESRKKNRKPSLYCKKCDMKFEEEKFYRKHIRQAHTDDKKKTNAINRRCMKNENASVIKSENGKSKKQGVYCRKCDIRFEAEKFYRKHCEEIHCQSIACTICGKLYLANRIKKHMIIHAKEKTHACIHCGTKFVTNTNLREHLRIHSGEKRYKCDYCGETFVHWNSRRNHIVLVHTKEKKYECYICHRKFALNSVMKSHILYHTGDMAHSCPFCVDKRFPTANKLKIHLRTQMHSNVPAEEKEKYMNV